MLPVLVVGDAVLCCDPACPPGVVMTGAYNTLVEFKPAARVSDICSNCAGCMPPPPILTGCNSVLVGFMPIAHALSVIPCGFPIPTVYKTLVGI